ncbi:MAG TPA: lysozyme inhibitor LprI family protein [Virgibacillus sp.]|nr:lysozyme inhibitor LprI family protein [Virgibacillus sp.]HLR67068.1 lysozyme inhibitor LprI family protein [Virgibacillus sp.]
MYKRNFIVLSCFLLILFLGACATSGDSEEESSIELTEDEDSRADDSEKNEERDTESDDTNNDEEDVATDVQDPQEDNNNSEETDAKIGLKKVYLEKLNEAKNEWDDKEPTDSSTYAQKNLEGEKFDVWDGLLNEVYGVLEEKLSKENMDQLREEQRNWLSYRDETAKEASLKYEGGTQEHLEYTAVLVVLTEERSFELVDNYME